MRPVQWREIAAVRRDFCRGDPRIADALAVRGAETQDNNHKGGGSMNNHFARFKRCAMRVSVAVVVVMGTINHASAQALDARTEHTATALQNGKVLIAGGDNASGNRLATAVIYDPVSRTSTAVANMTTPRAGHTAVSLPNGKVLVAGGRTTTAVTASTELYDPAMGMWSQ